MGDELDRRAPLLGREQLPPGPVDEHGDAQAGPGLDERGQQAPHVGPDSAHPRLQEEGVHTQVLQPRARPAMAGDATDTLPPRAGRRRAGGPRWSPRTRPHVLDDPTAGGRVIRGSVLRTAGYATGVGLGLVSAAVMTRYLGVDDFGKYVTVFSIVTVAAGMSDVGLANIGVREYSVRDGADRDQAMKNLLGLRIALTLLAALIAVAFAAVAGYEALLVGGTALAAVGYGLYTAQQTLAVPLAATLRFGWVAGLDVIRQLGTLVFVVLFVLAGAGLLAFFATPIPVAVALLVVTAALVRGSIPLTPSFHPRACGRCCFGSCSPTRPRARSARSTSISWSSSPRSVSSETETGYFGAAFRVFIVLGAIPSLLIASAFPVLARAAARRSTPPPVRIAAAL